MAARTLAYALLSAAGIASATVLTPTGDSVVHVGEPFLAKFNMTVHPDFPHTSNFDIFAISYVNGEKKIATATFAELSGDGVYLTLPWGFQGDKSKLIFMGPTFCPPSTVGGCPNNSPVRDYSDVFNVTVRAGSELCSANCYKGRCYELHEAGNRTQATDACKAAGGSLVDIKNADEFTWLATSFMGYYMSPRALISSWETNNYNMADLVFTKGGAVTVLPEGDAISQAICAFKPEGKYAQCADCVDQCFQNECYRVVYANETLKTAFANHTEAIGACAPLGGSVNMVDTAAEFYWISAYLTPLMNVWVSGWEGNTYGGAPLQFTSGGINAGAITVPPGAELARLPVLCSFPRNGAENKCQNPTEVAVNNNTLSKVSELAKGGFPYSRLNNVSGASAVSVSTSLAVFSTVAALLVAAL